MQDIALLEMLKNGVHFGHQKKRWHPKMKPYIYTIRAGIQIIDLERTAEKLKEACDFAEKITKGGGQILFVATKRQAQPVIKKMAKECAMPYVVERWLGGSLTNFENISKLVHRLKDLRKKRETGELAKYTKKEQLQFTEEIESLEKIVGGIENMSQLPQALFIIDIKKERTALREARKKKIPVIALADTNCNPELVDFPIPANDDATKSIEFMARVITESIVSAQQGAEVKKDQEAKKEN